MTMIAITPKTITTIASDARSFCLRRRFLVDRRIVTMFALSDFENTKWVNLRPNPCQFQVHPPLEHEHRPPAQPVFSCTTYCLPALARSPPYARYRPLFE